MSEVKLLFCLVSDVMLQAHYNKFFLFVYCPDLRLGRFARPVERAVGVVDAQHPEEWLGHKLHLYAFMKDLKGRTSDTMYILGR